MKVAHVNLAKGFRGGERQTLVLVEHLEKHAEITQYLIGRSKEELLRRTALPKEYCRGVSRPYLLSCSAVRGVDLIHAHEAKASHFALMANLRFGTPYIITRRIPNMPKDNYFTRQVYRRATRIVAISRAIKNNLQKYDADLDVSVIPSMSSKLPVDHGQVERLRREFQDKFVIGHIGALVDHHKGQSYIVECARVMAQSHPNVVFLLLGRGRDEDALRQKADGLSNLRFVGFVENVGDYIELFDMFVFPSLEEGLGSILLDVMRAAKPIVASDVDGIPDIIRDKENGRLIPAADSEAMRVTLIELYNDEAQRRRLSTQASIDVEQYTPQSISSRYLELYRQLMETSA